MTVMTLGASTLGDRTIVLAAQLGDERALERVLADLAPELLPLALALTGGTGEADRLVGDALSRALSRVYERLHQLDEPAALLA